MTELRVAKDFSRYLGGRLKVDGPWSGEVFREGFLKPRVLDAIQHGNVLHVIFDGVAGMPSSFLEEAFGGLLRHTQGLTRDALRSNLRLEAEDPELWPFIKLAERFMDEQAKRAH